jgi:flavin reductase (DIM6/NTAB) family NADH-FMN oxidoreductase RutF
MRPLTVGVVIDDADAETLHVRARATVKVCERGGQNRLLGEIALRWRETIPVGRHSLALFEVIRSRNHCLPRSQLWRRYLDYAYRQWRAQARSGEAQIRVAMRDVHAHFVLYICPRPIFLVSVAAGTERNLFPMDLVGPIGNDHFALALHSTAPAKLLERSRRVALSSVPFEQTSVAYALGKNHNKTKIVWDELPFATTPSPTFGLLVPRFALRVRELEIDSVRRMGSHTVFFARVVGDHPWRDAQQMFQVHGFYEAWRRRVGAARSATDAA